MATAGAKESVCKLVNVEPLELSKANFYPTSLLVSGDMLMVTDKIEWKVWLYRHQEAKLLATSEKLESEPRGLCLINNMEICVTCGNNIEIMSVQGAGDTGVITRVRTLHVNNTPFNYCSRIVKCIDKVVVCGRNQDQTICWCIVPLTDGHVDTVHQISKGTFWYMTTKHNMIYISCFTSRGSPDNSVYGYDIQNPSKQTFRYKHKALDWPSGITVDRMGFIFVANYFPTCIHRVTDKCELVTIFREGMPSKLLYDIFWDQGLLFVTLEWNNVIIRYKTEYSLQQEDHKTLADPESNGRKQLASEEASSQAEQGLEDREQLSEQIPENSENDEQGLKIPVEILSMDQKSQQRYKEALRVGKVKVYNIRVMVVGHHGVGKTTLTKRLLEQQVVISETKSTEGIDVHKHCCKVSMNNRKWIVQNEDLEILEQLQPFLESLPGVIGKQEGHSEVIDQGETTLEELHGQFQYSDNNNDTPSSSESVIDQKVDSMSPQTPKPSPDKESHSACDEDVVDNQESVIPTIRKGDSGMMKIVQSFNERVAGKPKKNIEEATVGIWDFAGQDAFYTTHQTFLTWRAIYLLVTDLSKEVSDPVTDVEGYFDTDGGRLYRDQYLVQDLVEVWLNSIHCCEPSSAAGISVTKNETGTPLTYPSAGMPSTATLDGTHITSPSADTPVTFPSADTPATVPSDGTPVTSPLAGTPLTSPSADTAATAPSPVTPMTSSSTGTTVTSPSFSTTLIFSADGTPVTSRAAGITLTPPKPDTAITLPAPGTSVTSHDDVISATPPVILVGTHVDQIPKDKREEVANMYFQQIRSILKNKPTLHHLVDFIAIDNAHLDPQLKTLKNKIFQLASEQRYWGEEVPISYVLMEEELRKLKVSGEKVISFSEVEEIDQASPIPIQTKKPETTEAQNVELDLFLRFMHEIGTLIYFSVESLREHIVLDPQWLIDAQKSLITAEMFIEKNYPNIKDKWNKFKQQGKLTHELIDAVWTKENNPKFYDNKKLILKLLEQLNIIARPVSFTEEGQKAEEDYFLTPCMLRRESPEGPISSEEDRRLMNTSVLCFVFTAKFLPPPIFHRLLAACVAKWKVSKKKDTSEYLIFSSCCVFDLDLFHRLTLHCRNHIVSARITRMVIDDVKTLDTKWCTRVKEFITQSLKEIISYLDQQLPFELHIQSPRSFVVSEDGMVSFSSFEMWHANEGLDPNPPIRHEHINHARLCVALVTVCGNSLRKILLTNVPAPHTNIYQAINAKKAKLTGRHGKCLLNPDQIQVVFPDPQRQRQQPVTVDTFDLSLLYILIRNVSTVPAPVTGWGNDPQDKPRDSSLGASVERIRLYRNHIIGHSVDEQISQEVFEDYWNKFDAVLHDIETVIGKQVYRLELEKQRRQVISVFDAC